MKDKFMKRLYDINTFRRFIGDAVKSFSDTRKARNNPDISKSFINRILLAVTQVNGCRYCTYLHTRNALEEGMSEDEVKGFLDGDLSEAPPEESVALLYAEHYADSEGKPDEESTARFFKTYGNEKGSQLLGIIHSIMVGNLHGNMIDALKHRLKRQAAEGSTFGREIGIVFGIVLFVPEAAIRHLLTVRKHSNVMKHA